MEKLIMKADPSVVMKTDYDKKITSMIYGKVAHANSSRVIQSNSRQNDGSYIHKTKTPATSYSCRTRHAIRIRKGTDLSSLDCDKKNFSGSTAKEIRYLQESGQRLVMFSNKEEMKKVNSNVTIYNNRHKNDTGVKVKCRYDYDNLLILFYLTPDVQVSHEESQFDQEEPQCVPP